MTSNDDNKSQTNKLAKIFNYIGGTLIFFGITYFIFHNWNVLADFTRILVSLGSACGALLIAVSLSENNKSPATSAVFFILGGLLLPLGLSVTFKTFNLEINLDLTDILITGICFAVFLSLQLRFMREILLLFCILFGSLFIISVTTFLNNTVHWLPASTLGDYQMLAIGIAYLLLGYCGTFQDSGFTGPLYFFGGLLVLLCSFNLAGLLFEGTTYFAWEVIAPILVLLSFVLAIPLKSKSLLYLGAIFLIIYISSITQKFAYLFGNIGWPVVLIGSGVLLMLLGYVLVNMQKKIPK